MKRKRFTEEQIISVLKESEAGAKTDDICRRHGILYHVLPLAQEVRWHGGRRCQEAAGLGSRKRQAEADRRGQDARHVRDEGSAAKTLVGPWRSDELWAF